MNNREPIRKAILEMRLLQFCYDGRTRVVEPHQLALSAYWVSGYSQNQDTSSRWREYLVDHMSAIDVKDDHFAGPRLGYMRAPNQKYRLAIAQL